MRAIARNGGAGMGSAPVLTAADGALVPREIRGFGGTSSASQALSCSSARSCCRALCSPVSPWTAVNSEDWGTHGAGAGGGNGPAARWWEMAAEEATAEVEAEAEARAD
eukprot:COSAG04_NODE_517_length_13186_cov_7.434248_4_plen_109_part_00